MPAMLQLCSRNTRRAAEFQPLRAHGEQDTSQSEVWVCTRRYTWDQSRSPWRGHSHILSALEKLLSSVCTVKGMLSHHRLRPNQNKTPALCRFSLLPRLLSSETRPSAVSYFLFGICVCMHACVGLGVHSCMYMWRSEDSPRGCS